MKKTLFATASLAVVFIILTAFNSSPKVSVPDFIQKDYQFSVYNADLAERFEIQFPDIVKNVSHVDVHFNEESGYYYTVYGNNQEGQAMVDYFKTTEEEVENGVYNYIEMTERTMQEGSRKCREATTFPFHYGQFCHPNNPGYICGIEVWPGVCFLY